MIDGWLLALLLFGLLSVFVLAIGLVIGNNVGWRRGAKTQRQADIAWLEEREARTLPWPTKPKCFSPHLRARASVVERMR